MDCFEPNKSIDMGGWSNFGGGRLERFHCIKKPAIKMIKLKLLCANNKHKQMITVNYLLLNTNFNMMLSGSIHIQQKLNKRRVTKRRWVQD